ncbi:DEAD/DEAH box helicase [Pseudomonas sp. NPDC088368]|uniref:DEAD/DEAH box helicase n=1 Tax=Pseudomonas sp. NPDC088368 TaxID=3364453 RepID=UPI0038068863
MASTLEEISLHLHQATQQGFRNKLLARGQSRGMIWRKGVLPDEAPNFSSDLSDDLLSYGYSLLSHALRFLDLRGEPETARIAFEIAAEAIETVFYKGPESEDKDFHLLIAASAYHLGRFSARAYSLLHQGMAKPNLTISELVLCKLMLRDLSGLAREISSWFSSKRGDEQAIITELSKFVVADADSSDDDTSSLSQALDLAIEDNFMAAMSIFITALESGNALLVDGACARLDRGLEVAGELNKVSQWWVHRIAGYLLRGLWDTSFHKVLPAVSPPGDAAGSWSNLRKIFIASLYKRNKSEIELWPSQLAASALVTDSNANLVLSLPTSAGKTRIAELCILTCLAENKRIVFITPLRALSAQTEISLRRTFAPLGKSVSSLYGSIGVSGEDTYTLRSAHVVVATPEKLDFALRNDPSLLDDVGLVVLDEGHMIGLGEREVRYEAQIQRLLRRSDARQRRIVCLSAILPDGDQLEDFAAWLTMDSENGLIKQSWRPTRLRYGEIDWKGDHGRLNFTVGDEKPFIPKFVVARKPSIGKARKLFPSDQTELCLASAWRLVDDGQTVLIFCPQRRSVMPFARRIIEMHKRGHIGSVLGVSLDVLSTALTVGTEWFGSDHDILACLKLGVAIHHGALPTSYRKEVERLVREGVLKITVSSPTLAQGLNLAATSLIFHGLNRTREPIDISEFRNVVGRAGRAYIDIEGLVLYPMFDNHRNRRRDWNALVSSQKGREMESGLLQLIMSLLVRMASKLGTFDLNTLLDYVAGQGAWDFPQIPAEQDSEQQAQRLKWGAYLMSLDTALLSLLGDEEIENDEIESKLEAALEHSLFVRRLARQTEPNQIALKSGLVKRAEVIWRETTPAQRRGYFLAGVGLATGKELDAKANELEAYLLQANIAIEQDDADLAVQAIESFAAIAFAIPPFAPNKLHGDWKQILRDWLSGAALLGADDETIQFIEQAFVYNLPWAMEAVRVRAEVSADPFAEELSLSDFPLAHPVVALETGTLNISAAILIQSGFSSRIGAIAAVGLPDTSFNSAHGLHAWLQTTAVLEHSLLPSWPTVESHSLWQEFVHPTRTAPATPWSVKSYLSNVVWVSEAPATDSVLRFGLPGQNPRSVFAADFSKVGELDWTPNPEASGLVIAGPSGSMNQIGFEYVGPDDLVH